MTWITYDLPHFSACLSSQWETLTWISFKLTVDYGSIGNTVPVNGHGFIHIIKQSLLIYRQYHTFPWLTKEAEQPFTEHDSAQTFTPNSNAQS